MTSEISPEEHILYHSNMEWVSAQSIEDNLREVADEEAGHDGAKAVGTLQTWMEKLVGDCESTTIQGATFFLYSDVYHWLDNWRRAIHRGDYDYLKQPRGLIRPIVSVEEFILSSEYLRQEGVVRYAIIKELVRLFTTGHYIEAVLTGGIGIGKNYFADLALSYMVYRLSCFQSPQVEFDLAPGSNIVFALQSVTEQLAKKVVFSSFREEILDSPYFQQNFPPDSGIKTELKFPNNISVTPLSSSDTSALGMNVFGGIIDEINFMPKTKGSQMAKLRGEEEYDKAKNVYLTILRRMKSRFLMAGGKLPGKLLLVASSNYPGDFTDEKKKDAEMDKTIFVMDMPQWEAHRQKSGRLDPKRYVGTTFLIEIGDERKPAQIIAERCDADDITNIIEVPTEYKTDFEKNMDDALRDIAGMPRAKRHVFISNRQDIFDAEEMFRSMAGERQLFLQDEADLKYYDDAELFELLNFEYISDVIKNWKQHGFLVEPQFAVHIDAGLTQDKCGIAVGRVMGLSAKSELRSYIHKTDDWRTVRGLKAPIIFMDGVIRIMPPPNDEIDLEKVQGLIFTMRNHGINIKWLSMDKFASPQLLQNVRKHKGIRTSYVSIDRTIEPYMDLKLSYREGRIIHPYHATLRHELNELILDREKGKVDHPDGGSKDIADAICGVAHLLTKLKETYAKSTVEIELDKLKAAEDLIKEDKSEDWVKALRSEEEKNRKHRAVTKHDRRREGRPAGSRSPRSSRGHRLRTRVV